MNPFNIPIVAVDKATQTVRNIKGEFADFAKPLTKFQTSFKSFSKETGLDKVGKGFAKVSTFAGDAFGAVEKFTGPLGLAAFTGGSAVAGVAALAGAWSKFSFGVDQASISLGMSTDAVQRWRLVNQAMGVDAQASDAAVASFSQTVWNARWGRDPTAIQAMNQLGMSFRYTKTGAIDTEAMLIQLSAVLQRFKGNPQIQQEIADIFGVSADLAELRKGPEQLKKDLDEAGKSGAAFNQRALAGGEAWHTFMVRTGRAWQAMGANSASVLGDIATAKGPGDFLRMWKEDRDAAIQADVRNWGLEDQQKAQNNAAAAFGKSISGSWKTATDGLTVAWTASISKIKALWTGVTQFFARKWADVGDVFTGIKRSITQMWTDVEGLVTGAVDRITVKMDQLKAIPKAIWDKVAVAGASAQAAAGNAWKGAKAWTAHEAAQVAGAFNVKRNNPGNLRPANGNGFMTFPNLTAGVAAMGRQLGIYQDRHGLNTIAGIVNRWAPPSENNTQAYIADVSKWTGFASNQPLNLHDPKTLSRLEAAMMRQEQGREVLTPEQVQAAIGGFAGANAGGGAGNQSGAPMQSAVKVDVNVKHNGTSAMVRTTSSGSPVTATARIEKSMPAIAA